jgi:hypothetical protein
MEARARQSLAAIKPSGGGEGDGGGGLSSATVEALFQAGWRSAAEVAAGKPDELATITGIGTVDAAKGVIAAAAKAAEIERARMAEEAAARAATEAAGLPEPGKEAEGQSPGARQG